MEAFPARNPISAFARQILSTFHHPKHNIQYHLIQHRFGKPIVNMALLDTEPPLPAESDPSDRKSSVMYSRRPQCHVVSLSSNLVPPPSHL